MIIKKERLRGFLDRNSLTPTNFANIIDVELCEVEKLLNGEAVGVDTARKFINFFKADIAERYIDWKAMNIESPLRNKR